MTTTKNRVSDWDTTRQKLAQTRDELKLKVHLAKADAADEWNELEDKWHHFECKMGEVQRATSATTSAVWEDIKGIADDLQDGYKRIRHSF